MTLLHQILATTNEDKVDIHNNCLSSVSGIPNMDKLVIEEDLIFLNYSKLMLILLQVQIRFIQEFYMN